MDIRINIWLLFSVIISMCFPMESLASWMWLGVASLGGYYPVDLNQLGMRNTSSEERPRKQRRRPRPIDMTSPSFCRKVPGLVRSQRKLCQNSRDILSGISEGAKLAIFECQRQFQSERWNCTTNIDLQNPFGSLMELGIKEAGYAYAITSAGVVHAITRSCSEGNITGCTCHVPKGRPGKPDPETTDWRWGGCGDNINYAIRVAKKFVDAAEDENGEDGILRRKMNLHNNELGRQAIEKQMEIKCRCHGVSGSCTLKTCWKSLPSMHRVGDFIKEKYQSSIEVIYKKRKNKIKPKDKSPGKRSIKRDGMVHIIQSPSFCSNDPERGIIGTTGRECNHTTTGPTSCEWLCCGRGYNRQELRVVNTRCNCQFVWCCVVKCQTCEYVTELITCK